MLKPTAITILILSCVCLVLFGQMLNLQKQLESTRKVVETERNDSPLERLANQGYIRLDSEVTILNPGLYGSNADVLVLKLDGSDQLYFKEVGDFDISRPCVDKKSHEVTTERAEFKNSTEPSCSK